SGFARPAIAKKHGMRPLWDVALQTFVRRGLPGGVMRQASAARRFAQPIVAGSGHAALRSAHDFPALRRRFAETAPAPAARSKTPGSGNCRKAGETSACERWRRLAS